MRFNIALLPEDETFAQRLCGYAQTYLRDAADGYLLGDRALPHVTLCQFRAEDARAAFALFQSWAHPEECIIRLTSFYVRPAHQGKLWAGFHVLPTPGLLWLQRRCHLHLQANGLRSLTRARPYMPHVTLGLLSTKPDAPLPKPHGIAPLRAVNCIPGVGISTENGAFVERLG
ncbi:MAG: hypothetical protein JO089_03120 [Alphaproteobacteria bacterium]|nr:hypothetical protein [Alphaproteobacteria bacterium]